MRTLGLMTLTAIVGTAVAGGAMAYGQQPRSAAANPAQGAPPVLMTKGHHALCKVGVGDQFPATELPKLGGGQGSLQQLAGKKATVVCFWSPDRWMARAALKDLAALAKRQAAGVAVVGVAVGQTADAAQAELQKAGADFTQLLDADGVALAQVGPNSLPRIYVLDAGGKIVWFDIEYSEATRRELRQTLAALTNSR
jgi:peroxiredoxin